ncbi:hypothetical protein DH2020_036007 [Rehmannia glutinosa]|uniref:Survival protein SurE-like phosphatase/nucleotidase domain-containing protein n=1 Tax=Rehmannia glutinosa TaxID=99300 RepID=A0ABR0V805_REHGL
MENKCGMSSAGGDRPTVMVTNDDGIDAPGLRALVRVLVSTNRFNVFVCALTLPALLFYLSESYFRYYLKFYREKSAVSHSITWRNPISAKPVEISGAIAFAVSGNISACRISKKTSVYAKLMISPMLASNSRRRTPADCTSLGISKALFTSIPDLVISGINMGSNCGYHIVYSGTVAGAREAFFNDIPAVSLSYDWVGGRSNVDDFALAAEACLPIISSILVEIKKKTYPRNCFLNIDVPTNVMNHKKDDWTFLVLEQGYRLTKQGKSIVKMGWRQVTSDSQGGKMLSTMTMDTNSSYTEEDSSTKHEHLIFKREVRGSHVEDGDTDYCSLQEGFITISPLGALSPAELDSQSYFKQWLPRVTECLSSSALTVIWVVARLVDETPPILTKVHARLHRAGLHILIQDVYPST